MFLSQKFYIQHRLFRNLAAISWQLLTYGSQMCLSWIFCSLLSLLKCRSKDTSKRTTQFFNTWVLSASSYTNLHSSSCQMLGHHSSTKGEIYLANQKNIFFEQPWESKPIVIILHETSAQLPHNSLRSRLSEWQLISLLYRVTNCEDRVKPYC